MSRPPITDPTTDERGREHHPSFAVAHLSRIHAQPPQGLFDSSIRHAEFVRLGISRATRERKLHRDWIYRTGPDLVEVDMSLTQWGSLISSFGQGSGVPVTLSTLNGELVERAEHASRLAITAQEVATKTTQAVQDVQLAVDAVLAAFEERAGRRDMQRVLSTLRHTVGNLPSNMKFSADALTEHAEDVVAKAAADIEATAHRPRVLQEHTTPELEP